jgi:F-type H+-transporting ATPase subunit a
MIRLISFSFRLFGNIFAGSVLVMIITFLAPYVVPAPFMLFELFVGLIQAAVFALLTLFFIKLAIMDTGH